MHPFSYTRRYVYAHEIQNKLRNYVLHNFHQFTGVNKEEILNLSIDDLFDVIADDKLNVQNEESVWEHCVRWIQFDEKNRVQYTQKLLQGIRLALMDPNVGLMMIIIILIIPIPISIVIRITQMVVLINFCSIF